MARSKWYQDRRLWLEAFALVNLGFLAPDIYLAHAVNLFRHAAEYVPLVFSLIAPVVLFAGLLAWRWQLEGQRLKGTLLLHLVLGLVASGMIWLVWSLHIRAHRNPGRKLPLYRLPIEVAAATVVALTAHLGGFLSGVNGPG